MLLLAAAITPHVSLFARPIDVVLNQILTSFGWVPIAIVLAWGFIKMWQNYRQGMYVSGLRYVLLAVDVPPSTEQSPKALENLFSSLYGGYSSLTWKEIWIIGKLQPVWAFEIGSAEGYVQFYTRTQIRYRDQIEAGIYAQYPDAEISECEDYTTWAPTHFPGVEWEVWGSELTTKKDFWFPIRTYMDFEDKITGEIKDPIGQVLEGLARMKPGEHFWYQILIQPAGNDWRKKGEKYIAKIFGVEEKHKQGLLSSGLSAVASIPMAVVSEVMGSTAAANAHEKPPEDQWKAFKLTQLEREQVDGVLRKIGKVGFLAKIRMVYVAKKSVFDKNARTAFVKGFLAQYSHLNLNYIGLAVSTTPKDDYFWQRWEYTHRQERLVKGFQTRSWGIGATPIWLNVEEIASLWHFPTLASRAPMTKRTEARRAEPPIGLPVTYDEPDLPKGPPAAPAAAPHSPSEGGIALHGAHMAASAHAEPPHDLPEEPLDLPHPTMPGVHAPMSAPSEEQEGGLDAADIVGPPADIVLPGPPPGWHEDAGTQTQASGEDEPPPNLPV